MPQKFSDHDIEELKKRAREKPLTDRTLKSLHPAANGKPYDLKDIGSRGLHVRVLPSGQRTFVLVARYPGSPHPARRALGVYDDMSLEEARDKARDWRNDIKKKIDPKAVEKKKRIEKEREQKNTFRAVLAAFNADKLEGLRRGHEVNRDLEKLAEDTGAAGRSPKLPLSKCATSSSTTRIAAKSTTPIICLATFADCITGRSISKFIPAWRPHPAIV